ncbi:hypothetical protein FRC16_000151, partial [Serendipita sp. 398]
VIVETSIHSGYRVKVKVDGSDIQLTRSGQTSVWTPPRSLEVSDSSKVQAMLKTGRTVAGVSLRKEENVIDIDVKDAIDQFLLSMSAEVSVSDQTTFRQQPVTVTVFFHSAPTSESVRATLQNLQDVMEEFRHIMGDSTLKNVETAIKYGVAFSELDPRSKAAFSVLTVTFELLKQQKDRDQMVSDLTRHLKRILPFAKEALKEAVEDNADVLRKAIGRLYVLTMDVAEFSCDYVKRNRFKRLAKAIISSQDQGKISDLTSGFSVLVEDFDRAVNVETLKAVRNMEEKVLLDRLQPIQTGYRLDRGCMEGTRVGVLDEIAQWAMRSPIGTTTSSLSGSHNVYWLYGIPGIGKTALAHSICARLHKEGRLGGAFFCRRDDPDLSDPKSVIPTLVFNLAETWGPYRKLIADKLRKDPKLTRHSADDQLFSVLLDTLQSHPPHPLLLVIDALDECGDSLSRSLIIANLIAVSLRVNWLRIIVTSRQDSDIESSFGRFDGRYLAKDLTSDDQAHDDIHFYTRTKLLSIAERRGLAKDWPGNKKLNEIVQRSGGLFIFVETLLRLLEKGLNPDRYLKQALSVGSGSALERLHSLYTTAIRSQIDEDEEEFRSAMGTIIVVGQYRPLSDEAVAQLSGLPTNIVFTLVNKLGSILYRDARASGGIRVRHLSAIDFLTSSTTPEDLKVDTKQAHRDVGVACLKTMTLGLRFNICGIESSFLANRDIVDLQSRVDENLSDALQYSCLHWSDHLSHVQETEDREMVAALDTFTKVPRLLYWMDALGVMGKVSVGDSVLRRVPVWLKCLEISVEERIEDALKFILTFQEAIKTSAPHIYISGLGLIPTDTDLWRRSSGLFRNLPVVEKGRKRSWGARPHTLRGHDGVVSSVACSPDGRRIISGSLDNTLRMWDAETGATVGEPLEGHTSWINSVAYSPDGRHIISGSRDWTIRMWDAETGVAVGGALMGHSDWVRSVAYSPDGRHIISGSDDRTIRIWDAETGATTGKPFEGHSRNILSVAYSPDGRHIISGSDDKTIRVWDAETGDAVGDPLAGHSRSVLSVVYSPDGHYIISGSEDKTIRIWDAGTGASVGDPLVGHTGPISSVVCSPNGRRIFSGSADRTIRIWDGETRTAIGEPLEHIDCMCTVAYSPDGCIISGSEDSNIYIWDAETGAAVGEQLEGHSGWILSVAYSPDGRKIITSSEDRTVRIWDAHTGSAVGDPFKGHTDWVNSIAYSPDGSRIISGSYDKTVRIWDAQTGAVVGIPFQGHTDCISSVAYSPNGSHIISGSHDKTIRIWNAETGVAVGGPLGGHSDSILSVAYSPDSRYIISGSRDRTIRIWDAQTGAAIGQPLKGHTDWIGSVAYSPDGRRIISGSGDRTIRIWNAETGAAVGQPLEGHNGSVSGVAYSPDGRRIISGSGDKTIRVWDAETGTLVGEPLEGHSEIVRTVKYSPDGCCIVSISHDRTIRIWGGQTGVIVRKQLEAHAPNISDDACSPEEYHVLSDFNGDTIRVRDPAK